jgi:hypothetical protein
VGVGGQLVPQLVRWQTYRDCVVILQHIETVTYRVEGSSRGGGGRREPSPLAAPSAGAALALDELGVLTGDLARRPGVPPAAPVEVVPPGPPAARHEHRHGSQHGRQRPPRSTRIS